jgi:hypothetical protein
MTPLERDRVERLFQKHNDNWTWAKPRPLFMKEAEPLARKSSWPTPYRTSIEQVAEYRRITMERLYFRV